MELTMRDGLPFSSKVISDGTLRVLALLTLLHDPKHRGVVCFEEPENGVHPGRIRKLVQALQELVTRPAANDAVRDDLLPLSQLLLNSHSPVVLSSLLDKDNKPVDGLVLFADTSTINDPKRKESRRHTRLRPVRNERQRALFTDSAVPQGFVSDLEVQRVLDTVGMED